jgi:hypothetical protein
MIHHLSQMGQVVVRLGGAMDFALNARAVEIAAAANQAPFGSPKKKANQWPLDLA